jgi:hypothetical protein
MTPIPTTVLPYGDLPTRWGVTSEKHATGLRIVIPPVPGWRHRPKTYGLIVLPLYGLCATGFNCIVDSSATDGALPALLMHGVIVAGIVAEALWRLSRRTIIDVTAEELAIAVVNRAGVGRRTVWPRPSINEVKINLSSGKLLIRIPGKDLVEYFISSNAQVTAWVAEKVSAAIFQETFQPVGEGLPFPEVSDKKDPFAVGVALGIGGLLLMGAGPIVAVFTSGNRSDWYCLGACSGLAVLVMAAGITAGTQERDFYF